MSNNSKSLSIIFIITAFFIYGFNEYCFTFVNKIPCTAKAFTSDNLGNVYCTDGEHIIKYNSKGELQNTFSDYTLGPITSIDASNPLKIIVFYKDFNSILILNNKLSPNGDNINLNALNILLPTLVCTSHDNGFWVYDSQNTTLYRFDSNLQQNQKTEYIQNLLSIKLNPTAIIEEGNFLYLNNPETGILIFDIYGSYIKTIPLKNIKLHQIVNDNIIYSQDNTLKVFNTKLLSDKILNIPISNPISLRIEKTKAFIMTSSEINVYEMKKDCL
ncbi:MAG: hypothetical protein Q8880_07235 [Bacteroidota bacterium]|nr:hypothetical protein [Bacteroidota bacterium]